MKPYIFYAWELSYFSGKLRAYLRCKGIPFQERRVNALTLMWRIPRHTGEVVMPVVVTPQGEWLQDTTHIIEVLDRRVAERPSLPATPIKRLAALLIEAWADEFWIPSAMHYRWNFADNYPLFEYEAGRALLPWLPATLRRPLARKVASRLHGYLPGIGVIPEQHDILERWTIAQLDALETHFTHHRWLLGNGPCLADFALVGPLYAHLGRDPAPLRQLIEPRPRLHDWIQRAEAGERGQTDDGNDAVPDSLQPIFHSIINEFLPMVDGIRDETAAHTTDCVAGRRLPRGLGQIRHPLLDGVFARNAMPYTLWMLQRVQRLLTSWPEADRMLAIDWLRTLGAGDLQDRDLGPALERQGLHVTLARTAEPAAAWQMKADVQ